MQFEHTFKVITDEGELNRRLSNYASQVGFTSEDGKTYRRGIGLARFLASYPRNTPTDLAVSWHRDPEDWQVSVVARLKIGGTGQLLAADHEYWRAELNAVEQALCGKPVDLIDLKRYAQSVVLRRILIGLIVVFGMVLGGTLARILFDNPAAFWMGSILGFGPGLALARPLARRGLRPSSTMMRPNMPQAVFPQPDASIIQLSMRRDIRSWGGWMVIMGIISFVSSGFLDSAWGVLLIVVGLGSFVFQTPAMYIVYGVTLVWAAVNNALLSSGTWAIFSLVQVFMAFQTFGQFRKYNKAYLAGRLATAAPAPTEGEEAAIQQNIITPDPLAPFLSWLSLGMGFFGLFGLLAVVAFSLLQAILKQSVQISPEMISFITGVAVDFNLLGFAAGLGSLLARHRFKGASIAGMIAGGLGILIIVGLMIVSRLG